MKIEQQIHDALHEYADSIEPQPGSWEQISARFDAPAPLGASRHRGPSRVTSVFAVAAIVLVAVLITTLVVRNDSRPTRVATGPPSMPRQVVALTTQLDLVVLDATTGAVIRTLAHDVSLSRGLPELAPTPDGRSVYFTSQLPRDPACPSRPAADALFRVDIDGGPVTQQRTAQSVAISPDGRWLATAGGDGPGCSTQPFLGISLQDLQTGQTRVVSSMNGTIERLAWSPNSRDLAFQWNNVGSYAHVLDTATASSVDESRCLCGQRDGTRWFGYLGTDGYLGTSPIVTDNQDGASVFGPDGAPRRRLFSFDGTIDLLDADASGRHVLVVGGQMRHRTQVDGLYRWSVGDTAPTKIADGVVAAAWIPDASPTPPSSVESSPPLGIAAIRNGELVVLGSQDAQQHSSLGSADGATVISATADGRTWVLGAADKPATCDYNSPVMPPVLSKLDTVSERRTPLVGGAYSPVVGSKGLIAYGYACDGDGLGFTDVHTEQNYRSDAPRREEARERRADPGRVSAGMVSGRHAPAVQAPPHR